MISRQIRRAAAFALAMSANAQAALPTPETVVGDVVTHPVTGLDATVVEVLTNSVLTDNDDVIMVYWTVGDTFTDPSHVVTHRVTAPVGEFCRRVAGEVRFRPVLRTSATAIGGMIPSISALLARYTRPGLEGAVYGLDNSIGSGARAGGSERRDDRAAC